NPQLAEAGGVLLAENEKEVLLLELFPQVAKDYLTKLKVEAYKAKNSTLEVVQEVKAEKLAITGQIIESPMPGRVFQTLVKVGDKVTAGQDVIILEAMKMENNISTPYAGTVRQILVADGDSVAAGAAMVEIS
ncbi:MAG: acetyl-CoA carboxylase biotin carboxyl carrier protein subunit, partial [Mucinivorans sp.]